MEDVAETLRSIVARFAPETGHLITLTDATLLVTDIGIDSPRMIDILLDVEDRFSVTIDDAEFQQVQTFGELVGLVTGLVAKSA
jgi:acyl carrier protein